MTVSINEIFKSIQGEGIYTGIPSVFVRFNGCNLRCAFANGSICDTAYTSWSPERCDPKDISKVVEEISNLLDDHCKHVVFTGGEPLLQQEAMVEIIRKLNQSYLPGYVYTVETNGSIVPNDDLCKGISLFSVSPKLDNSACFEGTEVSESLRIHHNKVRINPEAIYRILEKGDKVQLKFVYSSKDTTQDIYNFLYKCEKDIGVLFEYTKNYRMEHGDLEILLMPEGSTENEMKQSAQAAVDACLENGWRYCHRVHVSVWGNKRGV